MENPIPCSIIALHCEVSMLKKIIPLHLVLTLVLLTACGTENPSETVSSFITAQYKGDAEKAYSYLCSEDQQRITLEEFKKSQKSLQDPMLKDFFANAKVEILEAKEEGNTAAVKANQEIPDLGKILQAGFKTALNPNLKTDEERQKAMLEELGGKIPASTVTVNYTVVKENDEWKIKRSNWFNLFR